MPHLRHVALGAFVLATILLAACASNFEPDPASTRAPASPTVVPTVGLRPFGWSAFTGQGAELWAPNGYSTIPPAEAVQYGRAPDGSVIPALLGISLGPRPGATAVIVINAYPGTEGQSTAAYFDASAASVKASGATIKEQSMGTLGSREAGRLIWESGNSRFLMYFFKQDTYNWVILFAAPTTRFDEKLPEFEQIALTLRIF